MDLAELRRTLMEGRLKLPRLGSVAATGREALPFELHDRAGEPVAVVLEWVRELLLSDSQVVRQRDANGRPTIVAYRAWGAARGGAARRCSAAVPALPALSQLATALRCVWPDVGRRRATPNGLLQ